VCPRPCQVNKKPKLSKAKLKEIKKQKILKDLKITVKSFRSKTEIWHGCRIKKCKKCDFVPHSQGILRKTSFQNHVLEFKIDLQKHKKVPKAIGDEVYTSKCDICDCKASGEGKL
jgi:hypothetical protein